MDFHVVHSQVRPIQTVILKMLSHLAFLFVCLFTLSSLYHLLLLLGYTIQTKFTCVTQEGKDDTSNKGGFQFPKSLPAFLSSFLSPSKEFSPSFLHPKNSVNSFGTLILGFSHCFHKQECMLKLCFIIICLLRSRKRCVY